MTSVLRRQGDYTATERPSVGDLKMSLVGVDHIGWLFCNGRPVPIAAFRQLFDVVGYQFGTDVSDGFFRLPNPQGRVLGIAGASPDGVTSDWAIGDVSGYETHTLTVDEMPTHNHDYNKGLRDISGNTSYSLTGVTVNTNTTGITVDVSGSHNHGGSTGSAPHEGTQGVAAIAGGNIVAEDTGSHSHTISMDGNHAHSITDPSHAHDITDPTHRHMIAPNGGDQPHNNIQPTIWIGNLFVYSGRLFLNAPAGGNYFPPNYPARVF